MSALIESMIHFIPQLNHSERIYLKNILDKTNDFEKVCDLIESQQDNERHCPHCSGHTVYKHGSVSNLQRYKCQSCNMTFNALTGTPLARLRKKDLWLSYTNCMLKSMTIRKCSDELDIDKKTAFLWRHRFTKWLYKDAPKELGGIVEADETYYRYSEKGSKTLQRKPKKRGRDNVKRGLSNDQVCVLIACDRSRHSIEKIAGYGPVKRKWLDKHFSERIASDAVMVTDGLSAYRGFCSKKHIAHEIVKNKKGMRTVGSYHIQHVNSYHSRLRSWIIHVFHGVATKYLNHYLWWRHELESGSIRTSEELFKVVLGISPPLTPT